MLIHILIYNLLINCSRLVLNLQSWIEIIKNNNTNENRCYLFIEFYSLYTQSILENNEEWLYKIIMEQTSYNLENLGLQNCDFIDESNKKFLRPIDIQLAPSYSTRILELTKLISLIATNLRFEFNLTSLTNVIYHPYDYIGTTLLIQKIKELFIMDPWTKDFADRVGSLIFDLSDLKLQEKEVKLAILKHLNQVNCFKNKKLIEFRQKLETQIN